jgi:phosphoribosyl 1,2-cyclic phosphodiesterase
MEIRFWGVRGSVAASGTQMMKVGGNTSCVEVRSGNERIILDAGTGIRALGDEMMREGGPHTATLFFSHLHWDHVQGFPFFTPAYVPTNAFALYGPGDAKRLLSALTRQMEPPNFPVTLDTMKSRLTFGGVRDGEAMRLGRFLVTPFALPHPDGCLGYRIEADGRVFVYATDVELSLDTLTEKVAAGMRGADALCLDAQYTPDEYAGKGCICKKGWGHSTMIDAAQVAQAVGARKLLLFHHDPAHNDDMVERMAEEARAHFPACEIACESKRVSWGELHAS